MWEHPLLPGHRVVLAGNDGDDVDPYQERDVREVLAMLLEAQRRL